MSVFWMAEATSPELFRNTAKYEEKRIVLFLRCPRFPTAEATSPELFKT